MHPFGAEGICRNDYFEVKLYPIANLIAHLFLYPTSRWCYTLDSEARYEYCDVPYCGENVTISFNQECGTLFIGQIDYRGTMAVTATGKECQRWDTQFPHSHDNTNVTRPDSGLEGNYCK